MTPTELRADLEHVWSAETSVSDDWTATRPSTGQCAVTALLVQDRFGGDLIRATVAGMSHYFNRLPDGELVDLTLDQFDDPTLETPIEVRDREYVLSFPDTVTRYESLWRSLNALEVP